MFWKSTTRYDLTNYAKFGKVRLGRSIDGGSGWFVSIQAYDLWGSSLSPARATTIFNYMYYRFIEYVAYAFFFFKKNLWYTLPRYRVSIWSYWTGYVFKCWTRSFCFHTHDAWSKLQSKVQNVHVHIQVSIILHD